MQGLEQQKAGVLKLKEMGTESTVATSARFLHPQDPGRGRTHSQRMTHKVALPCLCITNALIPSHLPCRRALVHSPYSPPIPVYTSSHLTHTSLSAGSSCSAPPTQTLSQKPSKQPSRTTRNATSSRQPPGIFPVKSAHALPSWLLLHFPLHLGYS